MYINKKLLYALFLAINILGVCFLNSSPYLLACILFISGLAVFWKEKKKQLVTIYLITFVGGPIFEALAIASGVWHYENPMLFGFPIWLPFLWGNTGLAISRLSRSLFKQDIK